MIINKIRLMFLDFFQKKNHILIKGSSLIPENDSTLLFTNAGMNQFKDIFLGTVIPKKKSLISSQYCIRTGGKHNDFKKVGYTNYHHTLFEMLGNFSFGEYFKKEAISYAWEFLTSKEWMNIPKEKLWVTYYYKDQETFYIWSKIINNNHIIPIHDKNNIKYHSDNFWKMGKIGLCGPCTEIFYDQGNNIIGNLPGSTKKIGERYIEIWNIVFMQFNQIKPNQLIKIPVPSVDTGMGLERLTAILENSQSSYNIYSFRKLINKIKKKLLIHDSEFNKISLRIIADHLRTASCLISENIFPGNEGRNYILRKIIRRALSHGYLLGIRIPFLYKLSKIINNIYAGISNFFKIFNNIDKIQNTLYTEEKQFYLILKKSMDILLREIKNTKNKKISSKKIFYLYDTYGLPIEISQDICKKNNIFINSITLKNIIKENKEKQNKKKIKKDQLIYTNLMCISKKSIFYGYDRHKTYSKIIQIINKNQSIKLIKKEQECIIILDITPFYSESGGQIGDSGIINKKTACFIVKNTKKYGSYIGHIGTVQYGTFCINDNVISEIDRKKRYAIQSNHTATHLLHSALNKILGKNIQQRGSLINEQQLRFDFSYIGEINKKEINLIEQLINKKIQENLPITPIITSIKKAKKYHAIAQFTKKYKNTIRMIQIDNFSLELCGGTHHFFTGNIGYFKILNINNTGHDIKRIIAVTGHKAVLYIQKKEKKEKKIQDIVNIDYNNLYKKIKKIINDFNKIKQENKILQNNEIMNISKKIISNAYLLKEIYLITYSVSYRYKNILQKLSKIINKKLKSVIIILINNYNSSIIFNISVTQNIANKLSALKIMENIFLENQGIGGGNKNIAKGKLTNTKNIVKNLEKIKLWIIKTLSKK
ncbi:alanyl-tRNA synthetase [Buchnera aphidicola (Cinara tujafilina)]|uniref:Alanine--tRNA ligase n=1 Tax=Buchnera aphidicola (Cinara tujafilina) TaxID=261317 RepID=F7WZI2_9GAMM|nr:alanine--tRNA ligase [Buchnera aphidicola]AEH39847.1 alanyl-tRNA synthetase [Buchnera aphidicola (Cinara tujafilina)]